MNDTITAEDVVQFRDQFTYGSEDELPARLEAGSHPDGFDLEQCEYGDVEDGTGCPVVVGHYRNPDDEWTTRIALDTDAIPTEVLDEAADKAGEF